MYRRKHRGTHCYISFPNPKLPYDFSFDSYHKVHSSTRIPVVQLLGKSSSPDTPRMRSTIRLAIGNQRFIVNQDHYTYFPNGSGSSYGLSAIHQNDPSKLLLIYTFVFRHLMLYSIHNESYILMKILLWGKCLMDFFLYNTI